jgi:hypothetical protein
MIHYNDSSEQTKNTFLRTFSTLGFSKLLRKSGITKSKGIPVIDVFKFLVLLVFQGKNLYRFLDSSRGDTTYSKNTMYRLLNDSTNNWRRFLLTLSTKVISSLNKLTRNERVNVLILDDSIIPRNRSKNVELLAKVHDHTSNRFKKGFTMLALGTGRMLCILLVYAT